MCPIQGVWDQDVQDLTKIFTSWQQPESLLWYAGSHITAMTGAYIGTRVIFLLPEETIQKVITVALPAIALIMVLRKTDVRNEIWKVKFPEKP